MRPQTDTRQPVRSSDGSRPCAAAPGTGSTWSAPARGPAGCRFPQHLPEVPVGASRLHIPQRSNRPGPHLVQVPDVPADGAVRKPRRSPREDEPGEHVGLELLQILRRDRTAEFTQVPYGCQPRPEPPHLHPDHRSIGRGENASRILKLRHRPEEHPNEAEHPGHGDKDSVVLGGTHGMSHTEPQSKSPLSVGIPRVARSIRGIVEVRGPVLRFLQRPFSRPRSTSTRWAAGRSRLRRR